jgi:hypothetical protein
LYAKREDELSYKGGAAIVLFHVPARAKEGALLTFINFTPFRQVLLTGDIRHTAPFHGIYTRRRLRLAAVSIIAIYAIPSSRFDNDTSTFFDRSAANYRSWDAAGRGFHGKSAVSRAISALQYIHFLIYKQLIATWRWEYDSMGVFEV